MTRAKDSDDRSGLVTGLFRDRAGAEQAFDLAIAQGYDCDAMNVVIDEDTRTRLFPVTGAGESALGIKAGELGDLGGPAGGTLGTLLAAVTAVGTFLLIPGLAVAGPTAAALVGGGAAAMASGLVGVLHDWGIPNDRIDAYEAEIKAGGILLGIKPRTAADARLFAERWRAIGAQHVRP